MNESICPACPPPQRRQATSLMQQSGSLLEVNVFPAAGKDLSSTRPPQPNELLRALRALKASTQRTQLHSLALVFMLFLAAENTEALPALCA